MHPEITVGLDGSRESLSAAHWAAREAQLRGLPLRLLHLWILPPMTAQKIPREDEQALAALRLLQDVESDLWQQYPDVNAARNEAAPATAGTQGRAARVVETTGPWAGAVRSGTVVLREVGYDVNGEARTVRRFVVGVDGSAMSKQALRRAIGQDRLTGAVVEAVTAWVCPVVVVRDTAGGQP